MSFVSSQDLSDRLGRDVTDDPGAVSAVESACDIVQTLAEQSFEKVYGDTVVLDGSGTDCLLLPELPALAAGTVTVFATTLGTADYTLADNGRLIRLGGTTSSWDWFGGGWGSHVPWPADSFPFFRFHPVWPEGRQNITVTYDHGNVIPPAAVREVALSLAMRLVVQGPAVMETLGRTQQIRYAGAATDLTNGELRILAKYRQTR